MSTRAPSRPPSRATSRASRLAVQGDSTRVTSLSWWAPATMSFEEWAHCGRRLGGIGRGVGWWIGDWLRFGNQAYGEKYVRAAKITGYDVQTLMNMTYVASRVEVSRRREKLSWSHHAEVAPLSPEDQDQWLDRAEECRLSVQDLRTLLRAARDDQPSSDEADAPSPANDDGRRIVCPHCGSEIAVDEPPAQ